MSRGGHRFKSAARRLQDFCEERFKKGLPYMTALHLLEKVEPEARKAKETSQRPFMEILLDLAKTSIDGDKLWELEP